MVKSCRCLNPNLCSNVLFLLWLLSSPLQQVYATHTPCISCMAVFCQFDSQDVNASHSFQNENGSEDSVYSSFNWANYERRFEFGIMFLDTPKSLKFDEKLDTQNNRREMLQLRPLLQGSSRGCRVWSCMFASTSGAKGSGSTVDILVLNTFLKKEHTWYRL